MRVHSAKQVLLLLAAFAALLVPSLLGNPIETASARACTFGLQFREIQRIAPEIVGDCLEPARVVAVSGDVLQQTTEGLLVWRSEDGWTAFTTSTTTWVLGKSGLQERTNDTRFSWESDADGTMPLAEESGFLGRIIARSMQQEPTEEPSPTPEPVAVGTLVATGVAGSAQTARFNFQSTIDRPGNFRVRASFTVTGPASIGHTNGLFTSSEQGDFAPQPYDPAPVVNGRRGTLNWPPDSAATPMGIQGRAFGEVFVQCLSPGNVTGSIRIEFIQEGMGSLVYSGSANVQCTSAEIFIPTPQPTETPAPTSTPTQTPTATMTPTPDETQEAEQTANAEATDNAAADETATAEAADEEVAGTATAEVKEAKLRLETELECEVETDPGTPFDRIVRVIVDFFQGSEGVEDAEIDGRLIEPDGDVIAIENMETDNGHAERVFPALEEGTYRVEIDNATYEEPSGDSVTTEMDNAAKDNNNDIDNQQSLGCPHGEADVFFDGSEIPDVPDGREDRPSEGDTVTVTVRRTDTDGAATVDVVFDEDASDATIGDDFTIEGAAVGTIELAFADGVATATFTVEVLGDGLDEGLEDIIFNLEDPTGGLSIGDPSSLELNIPNEFFIGGVDDDEPDEGDTSFIIVRRSNDDGSDSVVLEFDDGASDANLDTDFTLPDTPPGSGRVELDFPDGTDTVTVLVPIATDANAEPSDENIVFNLVDSDGPDIGDPDSIELIIPDNPT